MRRYIIPLAAAAALALPAAAGAKGPSGATLLGPKLERGLAIHGEGEGGTATPLGALVDSAGFFPQMYGQSPDPTLRTKPAGTLGTRYRIVYVVPGPNGIRSRVVQLVFPYASGGALTYMKPGQRYWGGRHVRGGWFRGGAALKAILVEAGLPKRG